MSGLHIIALPEGRPMQDNRIATINLQRKSPFPIENICFDKQNDLLTAFPKYAKKPIYKTQCDTFHASTSRKFPILTSHYLNDDVR
jgi:hypothetical protein